jgi:hypothetical protein
MYTDEMDVELKERDTIPPVVVLTSVTITNQTNYQLTYTVDGVQSVENIVLLEGGNSINRCFQDAEQNETCVNWVITLDIVAPVITITSPIGTDIGSESVFLTGTASDASGIASLTVNGQAVTLTPEYYFSTSVSLTPGTNHISLIATDVSGNHSEIILDLVYRPGDANEDGLRNAKDGQILANQLLGVAPQTSSADVDGNGLLNDADLTQFVNLYLSS